jgi:hypothetical protein
MPCVASVFCPRQRMRNIITSTVAESRTRAAPQTCRRRHVSTSMVERYIGSMDAVKRTGVTFHRPNIDGMRWYEDPNRD